MKNFIQRVFFPSYKRTISVLVVLILVLSVPITLRLVGQQQDLRQRAEYDSACPNGGKFITGTNGFWGECTTCSALPKDKCETSNQTCFWYPGSVEYPGAGCVDNTGNMGYTECGGGHCYNDQSTCTTTNLCSRNGCQSDADCLKSNGSGYFCTQEQSGSSKNGCYPAAHNNGAWCKGPNGVGTVASVCASGYCNPTTFQCDTPASSGGAPAAPTSAPAKTNELPAPSVSGQGYTGGCNSITLTWGAVPGATQYIIRQYNQAGVAESAFDKNYLATGTSYTVPGLISNPLTAYFFNIYATNGTTTSPKASILAATGTCTTGQVPPPTTPSQTCSAATCPAPNTCVNNVCTAQAATCSVATCAAPSTCVNNVCTAPNTTNATTLSFTISIPGIGISTNQKDNINQYPNKDRKPLTVTFWDAQGNNVRREIGSAIYSSQTGYYTGTVSVSGLSGEYSLKLRLPATLPKLASTKVTLSQAATAIVVPPIKLISGKVNHNIDIDNIGVDDYNLMISCINNRCNPAYRELADLNDDGKVDELDLNILYVGFANRKGD